MKKHTITIIGTGYVGLTSAAIFAQAGHTVYALDINQQRLDVIRSGKSFFFEEGLDALIADGIKTGKLIPTDSYEEAVSNSDIIFSCVGTPDNPDGSSNLEYVFSAAKEAAKYITKSAIYVQKSTVPVGTGNAVINAFGEFQSKITYLSNPEFLREGTALGDSLYFDRIVVGGFDKKKMSEVINVYKSVEAIRDTIAKKAKLEVRQVKGKYISTNLNSAELIKVTANAFLALKISFANSIAKLADEVGADINDIMDAVGADSRIGRAFLNAGRGYGGGCFPKDVSGLISSASEYGVDLAIMTAASDLNETMPGYIANRAKSVLGTLNGKKVAVLGLAFKAGTSDARRSPGVKIANLLAKGGATVQAYDPEAKDEAKEELRRGITITHSLQTAVKDADAVFIATEWPVFINLNLKKCAKLMKGRILVDCINGLDISSVEKSGFIYIGVGRSGTA